MTTIKKAEKRMVTEFCIVSHFFLFSKKQFHRLRCEKKSHVSEALSAESPSTPFLMSTKLIYLYYTLSHTVKKTDVKNHQIGLLTAYKDFFLRGQNILMHQIFAKTYNCLANKILAIWFIFRKFHQLIDGRKRQKCKIHI